MDSVDAVVGLPVAASADRFGNRCARRVPPRGDPVAERGTAATGVEQRLVDSNLSGQTTLCAHYAEAYHFVTELPTRRANGDDPSACLHRNGAGRQVVLIVDAPLRLLVREHTDGLYSIEGSEMLLEVSPTAPFLYGRHSYVDTEPIRGYLLR